MALTKTLNAPATRKYTARTTIGRAAPIKVRTSARIRFRMPGSAARTAATIEIRAIGNSGCQQANASPANTAPVNHCLRARNSMHSTRNSTAGVFASGPMIASWANLAKKVNAIPTREGAANGEPDNCRMHR